MSKTYRIEELITIVDERNSDNKDLPLLGINLSKSFFPSVANVIGTDLSRYKVIRKGRFACNMMHVGRDMKVPVALYLKDNEAIISPAYPMFTVSDENLIVPEYLMLFFKNSEFDREAGFYASAGIRGGFEWEDFCNITIPVPSIEEQRRIVSEYQTVERRIKNNESMIQKLEETAQAIYHHTFVEGIDENNLPEGWRMGCLGDVAEYVKERISTCDLEERQYLSTEDIEKDKKGIDKSSSTPDNTNVTAFRKGDILISNIRPYFKKIWLASFDGGCSTDVLCYRTKEKEFHKFLYYTLLEDKFFDYVVAGCKGTKMPRGDKDWNMQYPILVPSKKSLNDYSLKVKPLLNYSSSIVAETSHLRTLLSLLTSKLS